MSIKRIKGNGNIDRKQEGSRLCLRPRTTKEIGDEVEELLQYEPGSHPSQEQMCCIEDHERGVFKRITKPKMEENHMSTIDFFINFIQAALWQKD